MPESEGTVAWRLQNLERLVEKKADSRELDALHADMSELSDEVRGLRRALIGFAITVAGSAVVFAFSTALLMAQ